MAAMRRYFPHLAVALVLAIGAVVALVVTSSSNPGPSTVSSVPVLPLTGTTVTLSVHGCGKNAPTLSTYTTQIAAADVGHVMAFQLPKSAVVVLAPVGYQCKGGAAAIKALSAAGQVNISVPTSSNPLTEQVIYGVVADHVTIPFPYSCMWPDIKTSKCYTWTHLPGSTFTAWGKSHATFTAGDSSNLAWGSFGMGDNQASNLLYQYVCVLKTSLSATYPSTPGAPICRSNPDILASQLGN